jgi:putative flippase GtrA
LARFEPTGLVRRALQIRFVRFLLTGGVNTVFGYSIYFVLLRITGHAIVALTLGTIIGVLFNFMSTGRVVFNATDPRLLWRFVLVYVATYVYNAIGLIVLENRGMDPAIGALVLLPGAVAITWILNNRFVFNRHVATR